MLLPQKREHNPVLVPTGCQHHASATTAQARGTTHHVRLPVWDHHHIHLSLRLEIP